MPRKRKVAAICLVVAGVVILGVVVAAVLAWSNRRDADARAVYALIDAMPKLTYAPGREIEERKAIQKVVRAIYKYDLDTIRAGMKRYYEQNWAEGNRLDTDQKLRTLNYYLFGPLGDDEGRDPLEDFDHGRRQGWAARGKLYIPQPEK